jgi:hypothetical protein
MAIVKTASYKFNHTYGGHVYSPPYGEYACTIVQIQFFLFGKNRGVLRHPPMGALCFVLVLLFFDYIC